MTAALRVRGMSDLLDLIPSLLGFHPEESLVLVLFAEGRVVVTARADLADLTTPDGRELCFGALWDRFPEAECVAVAYGADQASAWAILGDLAGWLPPDVLVDVAHVDGWHWYADEFAPGEPYDPTGSALAAEATYLGIRVLPDRESLEAQLDPVLGTEDMCRAVESVIATPPLETLVRAADLLSAGLAPGGALRPDQAALLALAAHHPGFVEGVLVELTRAKAEDAVRLWTAVVRATPPEVGDGALIVLGLASWLAGDGAMVNVCLGRAVGAATESPWYRFLQVVAGVALPPDRWEDVRQRLLDRPEAADPSSPRP